MRILLSGALAALLLLVLLPGQALAHGRGSDATSFLSRVTDAPAAGGVRWRILGGDELLEVAVDGPREVIVLGHQDEPYLRIGPDGAFENRRSPTVALHRERYRTEIPGHEAHEELNADAAPDWVRVSNAPRWAWHDHRIHWMSPRGPDVTQETVLYPRWEVPVLIDGEPAVVAGELRFIPAPPWRPWLLAGLALALPALAGLRRPPMAQAGSAPEPVSEEAEARGEVTRAPAWPGAARPAAAVLALIALLNLAHVVEDLSGWVSLEERLFAAGQTALYLTLAFGAAVRARRGDYAGVTALGIGAGALFLGQGLLYLPVLGSSQVSAAVPAWLLRLAVGASLAQILPLAVVAGRAGRAVQPAPLGPGSAQAGPPAAADGS